MTIATPLPVRLSPADREALAEHFLALGPEDRRLRFGALLSDEAILDMEQRIDFERDRLFAVADDELRLLGVVHVAFYKGKAELGLSVLPAARGQGLGNALFSRAVMHLRNRMVREVFVHCLTENGAMMHLARKHRMRVEHEGPESDACLTLPLPTTDSVLAEWVHDQGAAFAHAVRRNTLTARNLLSLMAPGATLARRN